MISLFEFAYMQRALAAGVLLSVLIPMIGVVMVNRKTSMIGDALSHTSLAGVGLGLILGYNPSIMAVFICIISAFSIELVRKRFPQYGDMATAVIMSTGLGIAAILSDFAPGGNTFESYLFGSISSVSPEDLIIVASVFVLGILINLIFYSAALDLALDINLARLAGVPTRFVNALYTLLTAVTVALAAKIIGALLVASLIVLPVATALFISRSYKQTFFVSILLGVIYTTSGLILSYYYDIRPGGAIVLIAVIAMIIFAVYAKLRKVHSKESRMSVN